MNIQPNDHELIEDADVITDTVKFRRATLGTLKKIKEDVDELALIAKYRKPTMTDILCHLIKKRNKPNGVVKSQKA